MDKSRVEHLLGLVAPEEKTAIGTLYNATVSTLKAYQEANSASRLRDWQAADAALEQMVIELEAKYCGKPNAFANVKEALEFLKAQGYKIAKSKMYADAQRGILAVQEDRGVLESDVLAYAVRAGLEKTPDKSTKVDDRIFADKASAELDLLRAREAKLRFEHEREMGLYILASDARAEWAMKLGALEAQIKNTLAVNKEEYIEIVGGDPKKAPEFQERAFEDVDGAFNEVANLDELQIVLRLEGSD